MDIKQKLIDTEAQRDHFKSLIDLKNEEIAEQGNLIDKMLKLIDGTDKLISVKNERIEILNETIAVLKETLEMLGETE